MILLRLPRPLATHDVRTYLQADVFEVTRGSCASSTRRDPAEDGRPPSRETGRPARRGDTSGYGEGPSAQAPTSPPR
jgi:hypothetical protein